jgi:hypothetical protein
MISVHKVIFPGIVAGCLFLVLVTSLITNPDVALAFSEQVITPAAQIGAGIAAAEISADPVPTPEPPPEQETAQAVESAPAEDASPDCSLPSGYPDSIRQWCGLIETYAGQHGLDPNLIAAVMLQESGGNPQAYSKSGAVGLMQVMPNDGLAAGFMCINGPCFASRPSSAELYDPEFNVAYGTQMLAGLIQKKGSVREALRSYGPMNMGYRYADIVLGIMSRYQ